MSLFSLWLEELIYTAKADYYAKESHKYAEKVKAEDTSATEEEHTETDEKQEVKEETNLSDQLWDEVNKKFEKTSPIITSEFTKDIFTGPNKSRTTIPFGSANTNELEMSLDEVETFITDAMNDLNPEKSMKQITKVALICCLRIAEKASFETCMSAMNGLNTSANEEFNTIYKFFTGFPLFVTCSAYELSDIMTVNQIFEIVRYLNNKPIFDGNFFFGTIVKKVKEAYVKEQYKQKSNNGEKDITGADITTPILFNHSIMDQVDYESGTIPEPRISKELSDTILKRLSNILSIDEKSGVLLKLEGKRDNRNPNYGIDSGQGLLSIIDKSTGFVYKQFDIDLDTIAGTGINFICPAFDETNNTFHMAFVNIDREPNIIRKMVAIKDQYVIGISPSNREEYENVMSQCLPVWVYRYFDFSKMHSTLAKMKTEEKKEFVEMLGKIIKLPWGNFLGIGTECPRFRFKDYKSSTKFSIVSDSDVRLQCSEWMAYPYKNIYGKFYVESFLADNDSKIVISVQNKDQFNLFIDGQEIED